MANDEIRFQRLKKIIEDYFTLNKNKNLNNFDKECSSIFYHELENFFANSSVSKFFRVNSENLTDNLNIDYDGRTYVRMMKLFTPNDYTSVDFKGCHEGEKLDRIINSTPFYLRFYMPKNTIGTIDKKISRIVIMFNGMNEILDFELYDILGEFFANENIAAVLLPTPLHLNRRLTNDGEFEPNSPDKNAIIPSKWVNESNSYSLFYLNYLKSFLELECLINLIKGNVSENYKSEEREYLKDDLDFYDNYFDKMNVKVTLLGYSLGGLKSLGYFLMKFDPIQEKIPKTLKEYELFEDNIKKFKESAIVDSCITINSGPNLLKVNSQERITAMNKDDWDAMLSSVKIALTKEKKLHRQHGELLQLFNFLYYVGDEQNQDKRANISGRDKLKLAIDNYLAISGGVDDLVSTDLIQKIFPPGEGQIKISINQMIVAKGDHHPSSDSSGWHEMLPMVERNILDLINSCSEKHYTKTAIIDILEEVMKRSGNFNKILSSCKEKFHNPDMEELLSGFPHTADGDYYRMMFKKYYFRSKAFYPNFPEVINSIVKKRKRKGKGKKKK